MKALQPKEGGQGLPDAGCSLAGRRTGTPLSPTWALSDHLHSDRHEQTWVSFHLSSQIITKLRIALPLMSLTYKVKRTGGT